MIPKLIPFLALVAAVALFFGYVKPEFSGPIDLLKQEIQTDDNALASATQFKAREAELTQARDAIPQEDLDRINSYVPANVDTVHVVIDLNALAARAGVKLDGFSLGSQPSSTGSAALNNGATYEPVDLTFTATGTYSSFRAFLAGLENSLPAYDVTSLDVKGSGTGVYVFTLTVRTYELP